MLFHLRNIDILQCDCDFSGSDFALRVTLLDVGFCTSGQRSDRHWSDRSQASPVSTSQWTGHHLGQSSHVVYNLHAVFENTHVYVLFQILKVLVLVLCEAGIYTILDCLYTFCETFLPELIRI